MTITVRAHTKLMAAALAAGVVVAAAPAWVAPIQEAAPVTSSEAVLPASFVTALLNSAGTVVGGVTDLVVWPIDVALSVPVFAALTLVGTLQDPTLIGGMLSFLAQIYLNPVDGYVGDIGKAAQDIVSVLPNPIGSWAVDALQDTAYTLGSVFDVLPDTSGALDKLGQLVQTAAGQLLLAAYSLVTMPVDLAYNVVIELAYLPAELEATLESALRNPAEIPGLVSNLVYDLMSPYGFLGGVLERVVNPFTGLPGPIGDAISDGYNNFANAWLDLFDALLPSPVFPTPFATAAVEDMRNLSPAVASTELVAEVPADDVTLLTVDVPVQSDAVPAVVVDPAVLPVPEPDGEVILLDDEIEGENAPETEELVEPEPEVVDEEIPADDEEMAAGEDQAEIDLAESEAAEDAPSDKPEPADSNTDNDAPADNDNDTDTAAAA